jgi:hypothetical protein
MPTAKIERIKNVLSVTLTGDEWEALKQLVDYVGQTAPCDFVPKHTETFKLWEEADDVVQSLREDFVI